MTLNTIRRVGRRGILLVLVASALTFAACGGDEAAAPRGAVEDELGFDQAGIAERQSRVEAGISDCMRAQGFDYVPIDPLAQRAAVTGAARLSDEEFLNQFGYGISTLFGRGGAQSDPNERIRETLSPADRTAYERALWGENVGANFAQANDSGDFSRLGGCTKTSTEEVFGGIETLNTLVGKLDELDEQIAQDQRMVRAIEQWTACMADGGYEYEEPDDIDGDILEQFQEIVGPSVEAGSTSTSAAKPDYDQEELAKLQSEEVAIAKADLACETQHITPVEEVVRPEYETAFREGNQQLLTRIPPPGG